MRNLRLLLTLFATICLLALGAYALANRPPQAPGDDIIIKGGSMTITCGANHGQDCLAHSSGSYTYTHKKSAHILHVEVLDSTNTSLLSRDFDAAHQPTVKVTYR
jgi:hypothetical protein